MSESYDVPGTLPHLGLDMAARVERGQIKWKSELGRFIPTLQPISHETMAHLCFPERPQRTEEYPVIEFGPRTDVGRATKRHGERLTLRQAVAFVALVAGMVAFWWLIGRAV